MTNLLVELQTEELPPKALETLSQAFAEGVKKSLAAQHFVSETAETTVYGAPRRLAVLVKDVSPKAPKKPSLRSSCRCAWVSTPKAGARPRF